jgi:hypothetical protein
MTHLKDISKIYLEQVASKETQEEGYKPIDKEKENKMYRRAGNLARTSLSARGKKKEDAQDKSSKIVSAITRQKEKERFAKMGDEKARDNYNEEVKGQDSSMRKAASVVGMTHEALDPVGKEDADVDNDGKKNTKSDKYLLNRRKAIGKAMKEAKHATAKQMHSPHEVPTKDLKGLVAKAVKRIDTDVDGDTDNNDKAKGELGEFVPGVGNKRLYSSTKTTTAKESFSNWRQDLTEIMTDDDGDKPIKEKKVNNKIKINPKLGEAVEEIGGTLIEMIEIDEFDVVLESVYDELIAEGHSEDEVEYGIETALSTLDEGYYDSAVAASKAAAEKNKGETPKKSLKDRLKSAAKKAIMGTARAAGKVMKAKSAVQAAPGRAKAKARSVADRVKAAAKKGYEQGRGPVEKKSKTSYRGSGVGRKEKIGEEASMSPQEIALQKKKAMIDKMIANKRMQGLKKSTKEEPTKAMGEGLSVDDQMRISREAAKKRNPNPDHKAIRGKMMKKPLPKDTRTDAQKMTDATGPRPGSRYRGD